MGGPQLCVHGFVRLNVDAAGMCPRCLAETRPPHLPRHPRAWSYAEEAEFAELANRGLSAREIATQLHRPASTVRKRLARLQRTASFGADRIETKTPRSDGLAH